STYTASPQELPIYPIATAISLAFFVPDPIDIERTRVLEVELARFPSFAVADAWAEFGEAHLDWLLSQMNTNLKEHREWWNRAIRFSVRWDELRAARNPALSPSERFKCLQHLRDHLGPENWQSGHMPDPPLHRFKNGPPPPSPLKS